MKIKISHFLFAIFIGLIFCTCTSQDKKTEVDIAEPENRSIVNKKPIAVTDKLYNLNPIYISYFPDTTLHFKNADSLRDYRFSNWERFIKFCDSRSDSMSNKDSVVLENRAAGIRYTELMEVIDYNFIKGYKKENRTMSLLSNYSPYSSIITLQQRIDLFNSFPENIKTNSVGKKTWERIQEYSFDKNINQSIHEFDMLEIRDTVNRNIKLKNIFNPEFKFQVLIFGASWCLPCRLEELQLKYWTSFIDTTTIKIIGLSIDRDVSKWKKYISDDGLPWECYLLEGEMNNAMVKGLKFEGIPRNFLIDNKGKILAENTDIRKILKAIP